MKQLFLTLVRGCIFPLIITGAAYAQNSTGLYVINDTKTFKNSLSAFDEKNLNAYSGNELSGISTKAVKDFSKTYKTAENTKWAKIQDGFMAHFTQDGIEKRTYYDQRGNWHFTISYYDEKKLPKYVRAMVKSTYYDYAISTVQELQIEDKVIYIIHMQDDTSWKTVRVCEDEMDVIENFTK